MQLFRARLISRGDYFRARFFVASCCCFSFSFVVSNRRLALAPRRDQMCFPPGILLNLLVSALLLLASVSNSLLLFLRRLALVTKSTPRAVQAVKARTTTSIAASAAFITAWSASIAASAASSIAASASSSFFHSGLR